MQPRIQYTNTNDGVRIAYWVMGQGTPIVIVRPEPASHIVNEMNVPELWGFYQRLAEHATIVRYDPRGCGMSDREGTDYSYDSLLVDLLAVIDALGYERVSLLSIPSSVPVTILFAARHPDRLSSLIILGTLGDSPRVRAFSEAIQPLMGQYPEDSHQIFMHLVVGWEHSDLASRLSQALGRTVTPERRAKALERDGHFDYEALTPLVRAPTLLVGRPESGVLSDASKIPGAQIASVPRDVSTYLIDFEPHVAAMVRFLQETDEEATKPRDSTLPTGTAIILFADIVDSTALTERLGDAAFRAKARELGASLRALIRDCAGTPVEGPTLGDGVLAVFTSAREAIETARRCAKAGDDAGLPLHLGLHAGDITREKDPDGRDNVYGGAVNIASRISGLSAPGEVLVSETVRSLARTSAGVRFEDRGEQALKGVGEAVRVWAVAEGPE